jgi:hypothetical protein
LGDRACCPVLMRVLAESCGPRPQLRLACSAPGSLSTGHFSQRILRTVTAQSPQGLGFEVNRINNLRVDESTGLFLALVGKIAITAMRGKMQLCKPCGTPNL